MFRFQPGRTYQMPVHFGPCCGPRSGPLGERFFADAAAEYLKRLRRLMPVTVIEVPDEP